jgi:hypothetical protein
MLIYKILNYYYNRLYFFTCHLEHLRITLDGNKNTKCNLFLVSIKKTTVTYLKSTFCVSES